MIQWLLGNCEYKTIGKSKKARSKVHPQHQSMRSSCKSPFFSRLLPLLLGEARLVLARGGASIPPADVSQPSHLYCIYYPKIHPPNQSNLIRIWWITEYIIFITFVYTKGRRKTCVLLLTLCLSIWIHVFFVQHILTLSSTTRVMQKFDPRNAIFVKCNLDNFEVIIFWS